MKKRVSRIGLFLVLALLLLLVSCNKIPQGEKPADTAAAAKALQTGTQGVEVTLLSNFPPALIYDRNELIVMADVKNKGNYPLTAGDCMVQVTGFDPAIIQGTINSPLACSGIGGVLEGRTLYNLDGGSNRLEFRGQVNPLPENVFEYEPNLKISTCYHYHTTASPAVCMDPLFYQITSEQKACTPHDVGLSGQGAPVGVSSVGVRMAGNKAIFDIRVRNFNNGRVLSNEVGTQNCAGNIDYSQLDKVYYQVQLTSGGFMDCKPKEGYVILNNNYAVISCSAEVPGSTAYETLLKIDLDYSYLQSFSKQIRIIRTPQ